MAEVFYTGQMFPKDPETGKVSNQAFLDAGLFQKVDPETGELLNEMDPQWRALAAKIRNRLKPELPFIVSEDMELLEAVNDFIRFKSNDGGCPSPESWKSIAKAIADWLGHCEQNGLDWRDVTENDIVAWRDAYNGSTPDAVSQFTGRPLSRETRNLRLGYVIGFYTHAGDAKRRWVKPVAFTKKTLRIRSNESMLSYLSNGGTMETYAAMLSEKGRGEKKPTDFLYIEDAHAFIKTGFVGKHSVRNKLIASCGAFVGLRLEEIHGLTIHDVPQPSGDTEGAVIRSTIIGKGDKLRVVEWPVWLADRIHRYADQEREQIAAETLKRTGVYPEALWLTDDGKQLSAKTIQTGIFPAASRRSGITCHAHMLRHTFATYYYKATGNLLKLSQLLGHSSIQTTRRYVHASELLSSYDVFSLYQTAVDEI